MGLEKSGENFQKKLKQTPEIGVGGVSGTKEKTITLKEIAELEEPIKKIIEQLWTKIESGGYGLIIGDDVSGRIPAGILGGFIKRISKLRDVRNPDIIFIPGRLERNLNLSKQLQNHISKYGIKKGDKILIITEVIQSGETLSVLLETLATLGYTCDVATMGIEGLDEVYNIEKRKENLGNTNIVSGEFSRKISSGEFYLEKEVFKKTLNPNTPSIYRNKNVSGVFKRRGDLISRHIKFSDYVRDVEQKNQLKIQEEINKYRAEVAILVDRLIDWYLSKRYSKKLKNAVK